jgi:lysozyme
MVFIPRVVDIYHDNNVLSFADVKRVGIYGVIHKASQGAHSQDPKAKMRHELAVAEGLLVGFYHFNSGEDVNTQVDNFISASVKDDNACMVLDFEDNAHSQMTIHQAVDFMKRLEDKIGRECAIYSGNRLKETIHELNDKDLSYITSRRLWLAQYGNQPVLPYGFHDYWLWQYSSDGYGPFPHSVKGIEGISDLNICSNSIQTFEQLQATWAGKVITKVIVPVIVPTETHTETVITSNPVVNNEITAVSNTVVDTPINVCKDDDNKAGESETVLEKLHDLDVTVGDAIANVVHSVVG